MKDQSKDGDMSPEEMDHIREIVGPRIDFLHEGTAITHDFNQACEEIAEEVFE